MKAVNTKVLNINKNLKLNLRNRTVKAQINYNPSNLSLKTASKRLF
jgi:hypothetical protein